MASSLKFPWTRFSIQLWGSPFPIQISTVLITQLIIFLNLALSMQNGKMTIRNDSEKKWRPNWGPKGRKKIFWRTSLPYLRILMTAPPPPLSEGLDRSLKETKRTSRIEAGMVYLIRYINYIHTNMTILSRNLQKANSFEKRKKITDK